MGRIGTGTTWLLVAASVWLAGCAGGPRVMMPTPRLYEQPEQKLFEDLPPSLQGREIELLYVTDREPETDENGNLRYGFGRSGSLAFGTARVALGEPTSTWEDLLEASRTGQRLKPVHLSLGSVTEIARLPPDPLPYWKEACPGKGVGSLFRINSECISSRGAFFLLLRTGYSRAPAVPTIRAKGNNAVSGDLAASLSFRYSVQL